MENILSRLLQLPAEHLYRKNQWMFTRDIVTNESRQPGQFEVWVSKQPRRLQKYIKGE